MTPLLMVDICAGLKGTSAAMVARGWEVITLDNDLAFKPDILCDLRCWNWEGIKPDLMWFSPPCTEFAREFMPWSRTGKTPDLSIYQACIRIIQEVQPRYWIIENVKGAIKYFGKPAASIGPFFLWGFFPDLGKIKLSGRKKESLSSSHSAERAKIPFELSLAVAQAIEQTETLL